MQYAQYLMNIITSQNFETVWNYYKSQIDCSWCHFVHIVHTKVHTYQHHIIQYAYIHKNILDIETYTNIVRPSKLVMEFVQERKQTQEKKYEFVKHCAYCLYIWTLSQAQILEQTADCSQLLNTLYIRLNIEHVVLSKVINSNHQLEYTPLSSLFHSKIC